MKKNEKKQEVKELNVIIRKYYNSKKQGYYMTGICEIITETEVILKKVTTTKSETQNELEQVTWLEDSLISNFFYNVEIKEEITKLLDGVYKITMEVK